MNESAAKILICEDEEGIRKLLKIHIENAGFTVYEGKNGLEAMEMLKKNEIHLLLLDIMMPFKNGFEVIKELRAVNNTVPIIVITARVEDDNKILGLDLGADDYVCKPFNYREVISRVNAQLRRSFDFQELKKRRYTNGSLVLDLDSLSLYKNNKLINLNLQEFKLLEILMSNPGRVYTKEQLYEKAWENPFLNDDNTLMVHISRLRDKLKDNDEDSQYIETIRGLGYRMVKLA